MTFVDPVSGGRGPHSVTREVVDLVESSDAGLRGVAGEGVEAAAELLLDRHVHAVRALMDEVGADAFTAVRDHMRARLLAGSPMRLPVRMEWLSALAGSSAPEGPALEARWGHDLIWSCYTRLPDAWQTVLWHHVVEGDTPALMGRHVGMGDFEVRRALSGAAVSLRRAVARAHATGPTATCELIATRLELEAPSLMEKGVLRDLREHAKVCDDCLHRARDLFTLEFDLAPVLARQVLGSLADSYLRSREGHRSLGAAPRLGMSTSAASRAAKPAALLGLTGVAAAAVFSALTLGPTALYRPGVMGGDRVVADGRTLVPVAVAAARPTSSLAPAVLPTVVRDQPTTAPKSGDAPPTPGITGGPAVVPVGGDGPDEADGPISGPGTDGPESEVPDASQPLVQTDTPVGEVAVDVDLSDADVTVQVGDVTISPDLGLDDVTGDVTGDVDGATAVVGGLLGG